MEINWLIVFSTAIIPLLVGFVWYGPLFGKVWMKEAGLNESDLQGTNMLKITLLTFLFGMMLAVALIGIVIHQWNVQSVLMTPEFEEAGSTSKAYLEEFMSIYGNNFRTFQHGLLHGVISGIFIFLPIIGTNALYERKSFKYILVNVGFWTISAGLMGGVICAFA